MNVLVVEPGYAPYEKWVKNTAAMKEIVGGPVAILHPFGGSVAVVVNSGAVINRMNFNRSIPGGYGGIFGTFIVCGKVEDNLCTLYPRKMEIFTHKFKSAEFLLGVKGGRMFTIHYPAEQKAESRP